MTISEDFTVVLRGYDIMQVDALVQRVNAALESESSVVRATAAQEVRQPTLRVRLRGYDRVAVDEYLRQAAQRLG